MLWIEDFERFLGGNDLPSEARAEREVELLSPIRALLHLLDRCEEIAVVTADTTLRARIDIGKIARFVERVPTMAVEDVVRGPRRPSRRVPWWLSIGRH